MTLREPVKKEPEIREVWAAAAICNDLRKRPHMSAHKTIGGGFVFSEIFFAKGLPKIKGGKCKKFFQGYRKAN